MFLPLHDKNPLRIVAFQLVTVVFIITSIAVFVLQLNYRDDPSIHVSYAFGLVPSVLFDTKMLPVGIFALESELTLVSYMFLHGDWWHLLGNMLFLWVFGDNVEDSMGHFRFIVFYLWCGAVAGISHALMMPGSEMPLVGASGAISGILGGYLMLHPRVKVLVLLFSRIPVRLPAYVLLLLWLGFQLFNVMFSDADSPVAWWAHIGGFVAGMVLIIPFRHKQVPLFDKGTVH